MKRIYRLELFVELDDKNLDGLMAAAKEIVRESNPDMPEEDLVDSPGHAVMEITTARMERGRPPLTCLDTTIDEYGVPMPSKKEHLDLWMVHWDEYRERFLAEHPPIIDEDNNHTGEFQGYTARSN